MAKPWIPPANFEWRSRPLPMPNNDGFGAPVGWEKVKEWFVDHSGFGRIGEPALTQEQFMDAIESYAEDNPTHGYAITEVGQFQLFVGAYVPPAAKVRKKKISLTI